MKPNKVYKHEKKILKLIVEVKRRFLNNKERILLPLIAELKQHDLKNGK